ncbi:MAG: hypothetical protein HYY06_27220 [Deltaproteobacteria bacterium]|nr:hypothetical protein [Deltaproteobacteria bacterium]
MAELPGARPAPLPRSLEPQLATLVRDPPQGDQWLHEIKLDGYRLICRVDRGRALLFTRYGNDWTARLPALAQAAGLLPVGEALFDGEVVSLGPDGVASFQALQSALARGSPGALVYFLFDLVHCDGYDLRSVPLERRKETLGALLRRSDGGGHLRYSDHAVGRGPELFREACARGLEGIVSKHRSAPYRSGRTRTWLKVKCGAGQELVIGGFTDPAGSRTGIGALLVGYHDRPGTPLLVYAGRVGTGFTGRMLSFLRRRLDPLERHAPPFGNPPRPTRGVHWVEPVLVAQVTFTGWTRDRIMRHPSFRGLREDLRPDEIVLERPAAVEARR